MRDDYGVWMAFCRSFISPENEEAFLRISKEFLQNEPLIKENGLFKDIPLPYEDGTTVYSLYTQTLLGMMLACAEKKSSYAKEERNYARSIRIIPRRFCDEGDDLPALRSRVNL